MIPLCVVESLPHWVHPRRLGRDGWIGQVGDVDPQHHAPRRMWGTVTSRVSPPPTIAASKEKGGAQSHLRGVSLSQDGPQITHVLTAWGMACLTQSLPSSGP